MNHPPVVERIAHVLCTMLDDEWELGRELYRREAQGIYDREILPLEICVKRLEDELEELWSP